MSNDKSVGRAASPPGFALKGLRGTHKGKVYVVDSCLTVGREHDNDIVINEGFVSRYHATLSVDRGILTVIDNRSSNGTRVNDKVVKHATVVDCGDTIKFDVIDFAVVEHTQMDEQAGGAHDETQIRIPRCRKKAQSADNNNSAAKPRDVVKKPIVSGDVGGAQSARVVKSRLSERRPEMVTPTAEGVIVDAGHTAQSTRTHIAKVGASIENNKRAAEKPELEAAVASQTAVNKAKLTVRNTAPPQTEIPNNASVIANAKAVTAGREADNGVSTQGQAVKVKAAKAPGTPQAHQQSSGANTTGRHPVAGSVDSAPGRTKHRRQVTATSPTRHSRVTNNVISKDQAVVNAKSVMRKRTAVQEGGGSSSRASISAKSTARSNIASSVDSSKVKQAAVAAKPAQRSSAAVTEVAPSTAGVVSKAKPAPPATSAIGKMPAKKNQQAPAKPPQTPPKSGAVPTKAADKQRVAAATNQRTRSQIPAGTANNSRLSATRKPVRRDAATVKSRPAGSSRTHVSAKPGASSSIASRINPSNTSQALAQQRRKPRSVDCSTGQHDARRLSTPAKGRNLEPQAAGVVKVGFKAQPTQNPGDVKNTIIDVELMGISPAVANRTFTLNGKPQTLGRSLFNHIMLKSSSVSSQHAEIEKVGDRWVIRDLGSSYGTYVNGERINECELYHNTSIVLGDVELLFDPKGVVPAPWIIEPAVLASSASVSRRNRLLIVTALVVSTVLAWLLIF